MREDLEDLIDFDADKFPEALAVEPILLTHLEPVRELFWILNPRRSIGGGQVPLPNPISAADVAAIAPEFGIDPIYFLRVTASADALYLSEAAKRAEQSLKRKSKKGK